MVVGLIIVLVLKKNSSMKKVSLLIILLVSGIQVFAQVTDIKYLVNKTPQEMVSLYDNSKIVTGEYYDFEIEKICCIIIVKEL